MSDLQDHLPGIHNNGTKQLCPKNRNLKLAEIPIPDAKRRRATYGIDCCELVHFTNWEPGGEYVKTLTIKNVIMKTQKLRYALPRTRFFSMEFPETVTLSAGMSWSIPITFRPVARECYDDFIEFSTSLGEFKIPIKATLPAHRLNFPTKFDFGYCPVNEKARKSFTLKNSGELETAFEWDIAKPFEIQPKSGLLKSGEAIQVTVEFQISEASTYRACAICKFGDAISWSDTSLESQKMFVSAVGKFSHINLDNADGCLDFGQVYVGKPVEKHLNLNNGSEVVANFKIKNLTGSGDSCFSFSVTHGQIHPKKNFGLKITFTPSSPLSTYTEYYEVSTVSGNSIRLACKGVGSGPTVSCSTASINFGDVFINDSSSRSFHLYNSSGIPAYYQFLLESNGIFRVDKPWGTISGKSAIAINAKFVPSAPINYYRRVYCLIENHDAICIDFLATGYNERRRPASFTIQHLHRFLKRCEVGLHLFPPEQIEAMLANGILKYYDGDLIFMKNQGKSHITEAARNRSADFFDLDKKSDAIAILDSYIDFGSTSRLRMTPSRTIRVANYTRGKVSCLWINGKSDDGDYPAFTVAPELMDIPPKSIVEFKVDFRPMIDNSFFGSHLECYVYYKSMRSFRLVNDATFSPPWCLTTQVAGNTFPPGEDTFLPKIELHNVSRHLEFPPCPVGESVYRSIRVTNKGDTPVKFAFASSSEMLKSVDVDELGQGFSVKPRFGLLAKDQSQLVVFKFSPSAVAIHEQILKGFFNGSSVCQFELLLKGTGHVPELNICLENNQMIFRPTSTRGATCREIELRNSSKIPVNFEWNYPAMYSHIFDIEPKCGILNSNESIVAQSTFTPKVEKFYSFRAFCYYGHGDAEKKRIVVQVSGRGSMGILFSDPKTIDLKHVLINAPTERELFIYNASDCDVPYKLEVRQITGDNLEQMETVICNNREVILSSNSGVVPARAYQSLKICLMLQFQRKYEFLIDALIGEVVVKKNDSLQNSLSLRSVFDHCERIRLCKLEAIAVFPSLKIVDICSDGCSKNTLWRRLSLTNLNEALSSRFNDTDEEKFALAYKRHNRSMSGTLKRKNLTFYEFDFGAQVIDTIDTKIFLSLENTGVVSVEWFLSFPNELDVEIENWASACSGISDEQIHHNFVLDNHIFMINPKTGTLMSGERSTITITYRHTYVGIHRIPVIFKLQNGPFPAGKQFVLIFSGTTFAKDRAHIHIPLQKFMLNDVPLGTIDFPVHSIPIHNASLLALNYEIDVSAFDQSKAENYGFEVFRLLSPKIGQLAPCSAKMISIIFRPLELKKYTTEMLIKVNEKRWVILVQGKGGRGKDEVVVQNGNRLLFDAIPSSPQIIKPTQLVRLSKDRLNFGCVPNGSIMRDLVIIRNISMQKISFVWTQNDTAKNICALRPSSGFLAAGDSILCRVHFNPTYESRIHQIDIQCSISNEDEMASYQKKLALAEQLKNEIQTTILDFPVESAMKRGQKMVWKHKPLPPIGKPKDDMHDGRFNQMEIDDIQIPEEPRAQVQHITIVSKTFAAEEFRRRFDGFNHYVFKGIEVDEDLEPNIPKPPKNIVHEILEMALDEIMFELDAADALSSLISEVPPYYYQISQPKNEKPYESETVLSSENLARSSSFKFLLEETLEDILFNIISEANCGDMNITELPAFVHV